MRAGFSGAAFRRRTRRNEGFLSEARTPIQPGPSPPSIDDRPQFHACEPVLAFTVHCCPINPFVVARVDAHDPKHAAITVCVEIGTPHEDLARIVRINLWNRSLLARLHCIRILFIATRRLHSLMVGGPTPGKLYPRIQKRPVDLIELFDELSVALGGEGIQLHHGQIGDSGDVILMLEAGPWLSGSIGWNSRTAGAIPARAGRVFRMKGGRHDRGRSRHGGVLKRPAGNGIGYCSRDGAGAFRELPRGKIRQQQPGNHC